MDAISCERKLSFGNPREGHTLSDPEVRLNNT